MSKLIYYCPHQEKGTVRCTICDEQEKAIKERQDSISPGLGDSDAFIPCKICKKFPAIQHGESRLVKQKWISDNATFMENGKEIKLSYDNWPNSNEVVHKSCLENKSNPKDGSKNEQSQLDLVATKEVKNTANIKKNDKDCYYVWWIAGAVIILVIILGIISFYYKREKN